jgi:hypothetical protein
MIMQRLVRIDVEVPEGMKTPDKHEIAAYLDVAISFMPPSFKRFKIVKVIVEDETEPSTRG